MVMKSIAKKPAPGSGFDTYLLGMEETWWVRDHPFNARCVDVKRKAAAVEEAEKTLERLRAIFEEAVVVMNAERVANGS